VGSEKEGEKSGRGGKRKRVFKLCRAIGSPLSLLYAAVRKWLTKMAAFHVM
jgi:hypothetical protein